MQAPIASEGVVPLDVLSNIPYIQQQQDGIFVCPVIRLAQF